jgi:hypothetical protein
LIALASDDLAHNAAHNLARARLGEVVDDVDLPGCRKGTDDLANLEHELLIQTLDIVRVVLEFSDGKENDKNEKRQSSDTNITNGENGQRHTV